MMDNSYALAVDLGASGGKLFVGKLEGERAEIVPVHQFENRIINARGRSYWDFLHILHEIKTGYAKAQQEFGGGIQSIAIDSWCNDYALLSKNGAMLESPRNYRDKRTEGWVERAGGLLPRREVYQKTGQQFARFQTCYHLLAQKEEEPGLLELAASLLFIPDYLSYLLGAGRYTEYTVASVTNLFHITENRWDTDILDAYGLPRSIFMPIVQPGTKVGRVSDEVCAELKTPAADIYAVGSHDTACAVASAAGDSDEPFLFISSGTWSLVGVEIPAPILTEESLAAGFGNEGGVGGRIRYIKNVMGLWLLQECMRVWKAQGKDYSYARLAGQAEAAGTIGALIDDPGAADIVFDATSAAMHAKHAPVLKALGKYAIDMTPARQGKLCVPVINGAECLAESNVNCGGQATVPIASAILRAHPETSYIEVVSSIASKSAGPGTRANIDEFTQTTREALRLFTGVEKTKVIINLNPAEPPILMHNTIYAQIGEPDMGAIAEAVADMEKRLQAYVPGYRVIAGPVFEAGRVTTMIQVTGLGDYLPVYAGNLDIITCAGVYLAEMYAKKTLGIGE